MKRIEDFDIDEELRKEKAFDDNMTCAICSIGFSAATTSIVSLITGCIDKPETLPYFITGGVIAAPLIFVLLKKLRKKMDDNFKKDMVAAGNLITMLSEFQKQDRIIGERTSLFLQEIALAFDGNGIKMDGDNLIHVNQFLFLVNINYFEEIAYQLPSLTREKLIDHILGRMVSYYQNTDKRTFDEEDAKKVLGYCLWIGPDLKEKIYKEFKDSKVQLGDMTDYAIERKDIPHELEAYESLAVEIGNGQGMSFDITNMEHYKTLIETACENDYLKQYGNPHELEWDMDFLYRIMNLVAANYRQELIGMDPTYENFKLVGNYIFRSLTYALVNNRKEVGQRELLSAFKNYNYIPFTIKDKTLTKLFEEDELDYSLHPYRERKDSALDKSPKVIQFRITTTPKTSPE